MGYRGKLAERQQARQLRRTGLPLTEIALRVGASRSSDSLWFREVQFDPLPRVVRGRRRAPNAMIAFFCAWLRRFFENDEARLRVRLYLHEGLDLAASVAHWSELTRTRRHSS
jgi:hypothetical protein